MLNTETSILLPGPSGMLEALVQVPENAVPYMGIMCHPHPLHGGTMHNKVVTTVARVYKTLHMPHIRFNYRGVGQSEGQYDAGEGETLDALAVIQWALAQWPDKKLILSGFSFGAYVALRAASQVPVAHLITIAPAVNHADFSGLHPQAPWAVVIAEKDTVVAAEDIYAWINTLNPQPEILAFPDATHFFDGQLVALREGLLERLKRGSDN